APPRRSGPGEGRLAQADRTARRRAARTAGVRAAQRLEVLQRENRRARPRGGAQAVAGQRPAMGRRQRRGLGTGVARPRPIRRPRGPARVRRQHHHRVLGRRQRHRNHAGARRGRHRQRFAGPGRGRMSAAPARDPYLDLPLDGVRLIEASAGTGKTFTLATLVTRLVVERGLRVGQVLAVTFTEAATQELRKRIRERLLLALELVDAPDPEGEDAEAALTRQILHAHRERSGESTEALRRRLRQAALEIDLAAIFTIHGFCARALREHALESGQGFDPPTLLANDRELREELAADLWRAHGRDADGAGDLAAPWKGGPPALAEARRAPPRQPRDHELREELAAHLCRAHGRDADGADALAALWKGGPPALAEDLRALLREPVLLPPDAPLPDDDPMPAVVATGRALADGFREHGPGFLAVLLDALERKVLNGGSYKADWIQSLWSELAGWCEGGDYTAPLDERLGRFTARAMQEKTNKAHAGGTPT